MFRRFVGVFLILVSSISSARHLGLTIEANGWAPKIQVYCEDPECENISIVRDWCGRLDLAYGPVALEKAVRFLNTQDFPHLYELPKLRDSNYGPDSRSLLPLFAELMAPIFAAVHDSFEFMHNPNRNARKVVNGLARKLRMGGENKTSVLSRDSYARLMEVYERTWKLTQECGGTLAQTSLATAVP